MMSLILFQSCPIVWCSAQTSSVLEGYKTKVLWQQPQKPSTSPAISVSMQLKKALFSILIFGITRGTEAVNCRECPAGMVGL